MINFNVWSIIDVSIIGSKPLELLVSIEFGKEKKTMRDRLIELIADSRQLNSWNVEDKWGRIEDLADHLLANGVIVSPCKVGDELYRIITRNNGERFVSLFPVKVEPYGIYFQNVFGEYSCLSFDDFGKTAFLTKEEAEQELEKLKGDGNE